MAGSVQDRARSGLDVIGHLQAAGEVVEGPKRQDRQRQPSVPARAWAAPQPCRRPRRPRQANPSATARAPRPPVARKGAQDRPIAKDRHGALDRSGLRCAVPDRGLASTQMSGLAGMITHCSTGT